MINPNMVRRESFGRFETRLSGRFRGCLAGAAMLLLSPGFLGQTPAQANSFNYQELRGLIQALTLPADVDVAREQIAVFDAIAKDDLRLGASPEEPPTWWERITESGAAKEARRAYQSSLRQVRFWRMKEKELVCAGRVLNPEGLTERQLLTRIQERVGSIENGAREFVVSLERVMLRQLSASYGGLATNNYDNPSNQRQSLYLDPVVGGSCQRRMSASIFGGWDGIPESCHELRSPEREYSENTLALAGWAAHERAARRFKALRSDLLKAVFGSMLPPSEGFSKTCFVTFDGSFRPAYSVMLGKHRLATFALGSQSLNERRELATRMWVELIAAGRCEAPLEGGEPITKEEWHRRARVAGLRNP
jgi:hypothetical protein